MLFVGVPSHEQQSLNADTIMRIREKGWTAGLFEVVQAEADHRKQLYHTEFFLKLKHKEQKTKQALLHSVASLRKYQ